MKFLKIILVIIAVLLAILVGVSVYVWWQLQGLADIAPRTAVMETEIEESPAGDESQAEVDTPAQNTEARADHH